MNTTSLLESILFADDTTLLFSHPNIELQNDLINNELSQICNRFQANKLSVNASKTNYMVLTNKPNIQLDDESLSRISSTKFLEVIIDENLTWRNHIDAISKTISKNVGILNKLKHFVPQNIVYSLYFNFTLCKLWYSDMGKYM